MLTNVFKRIWVFIFFGLVQFYTYDLFGENTVEDYSILTSIVKLKVVFIQPEFNKSTGKTFIKSMATQDCSASVLSDNVLLTAAHCLIVPGGWMLYTINYEYEQDRFMLADTFYIRAGYKPEDESLNTEKNLEHVASDIAVIKFLGSPFKSHSKLKIDTTYSIKTDDTLWGTGIDKEFLPTVAKIQVPKGTLIQDTILEYPGILDANNHLGYPLKGQSGGGVLLDKFGHPTSTVVAILSGIKRVSYSNGVVIPFALLTLINTEKNLGFLQSLVDYPDLGIKINGITASHEGTSLEECSDIFK